MKKTRSAVTGRKLSLKGKDAIPPLVKLFESVGFDNSRGLTGPNEAGVNYWPEADQIFESLARRVAKKSKILYGDQLPNETPQSAGAYIELRRIGGGYLSLEIPEFDANPSSAAGPAHPHLNEGRNFKRLPKGVTKKPRKIRAAISSRRHVSNDGNLKGINRNRAGY